MMRYLRTALGGIVGYAIVAGGLSLLVMTWWINETLPVTALWIGVILIALPLIGWVAGKMAALIAGELAKAAIYIVCGMTLAIMTMNIVLDVAAEPLWFKLCAIGLIIPGVLRAGPARRTSP